MDLKKVGIIGSAVLVMGSFAMAASVTPRKAGDVSPVGALRKAPLFHAGAPSTVAQSVTQAPAPAQATNLELVAPPAELPKANSQAMVTSVALVAPATPLKAGGVDSRVMKLTQDVLGKGHSKAKATAPAGAAVAGVKVKAHTAAAAAPAKKPGKLFSYVRMLNFSPHPQQEEFLRDKPIAMKGNKYHIDVAYNEDWNVVSDDEGYLKKIGFTINLFENGKIVRTLKTPAVAIDVKNIKKGQVLALAEVAPYKFNVAVDSFAATPKGIKELVFKFDMTN